MNIPDEFNHRVFRTRFSGFSSKLTEHGEIKELAPGAEMDVMYEKVNGKLKSVVVIVFETQEDCLVFTLKYGNKYG